MTKCYYVNGEFRKFKFVYENCCSDGSYLAVDTKTKEEVWLYPNGIIEYTKDHRIVRGSEIFMPEPEKHYSFF